MQAVFEGRVNSLRRVKDDVDSVQEGLECGLGAEGFVDWREGDKIECFTVREVGAACPGL
jgi:translation initiation factor IF-2